MWCRRFSPVICAWETACDWRRQQQQRVTTALLAAARPVAVATSETCTVPGWVINNWCNGGYESTFRKLDGWIKLTANAACQRYDPSWLRTKGQSILLNKSQRRREYSEDGLCVRNVWEPQMCKSWAHTHTRMHTRTHTRACSRTQTRTHTHTHAHTHTSKKNIKYQNILPENTQWV